MGGVYANSAAHLVWYFVKSLLYNVVQQQRDNFTITEEHKDKAYQATIQMGEQEYHSK